MNKAEMMEALRDKSVIIYGAHLVATELYRYIHELNICKVLGFAVTSTVDNPDEIDGIKVSDVKKYHGRTDALVLVAVPRKYHREVVEYLISLGFTQNICIDQENMELLKGELILEKWKDNGNSKYCLYEDENDKSWLNLKKAETDTNNCDDRHLKFPTLFHIPLPELLEKMTDEGLDKLWNLYGSLQIVKGGETKKEVFGEISDAFKVYMVFSQWDNGDNSNKVVADWIQPIQAGSVLTEKKIGRLLDESGDNISSLNRNFAELTISYWVWKNESRAQYKGICHYRRHFVLNKEKICELMCQDVDVILTTPRYAPGGVENMFLAETPVKEKVFDILKQSVNEIHTNDVEAINEYFSQELYCPNNMVIAKRAIYDEYCQWLFPVLFKMIEIDKKYENDHENDRHVAYAAELLTSYYFVFRRKGYSIHFVDYEML